METYIVLISVGHNNARRVCEFIQNETFDNKESARKTINEELGVDVDNWVPILSLNDFMDEVNDQYLDNLTEYFISYVKIGE
jgi:hypothetical protein